MKMMWRCLELWLDNILLLNMLFSYKKLVNYWMNNTLLKKCSLKTPLDFQQDKG